MMDELPLYNILFLDIETVSAHAAFEEMDAAGQALWKEKARYWLKDYGEDPAGPADCYRDRAAILAEFGRVVCISAGLITRGEDPAGDGFRLKSFAGEDERQVLADFSKMLDQHFSDTNRFFICGHNIREFDVPYLGRRMIMHGLPLPAMLRISGKKPWEVRHLIDTLELWKFGDIKHYTSLKLLAYCLGIPSPKEDLDGSQVGRVFYQEKDLPAITRYCEKDVLTVAQVVRRMGGKPLITEELVTVSET